MQLCSSLSIPGGSDSKVSAYNVGDLGLIPGLERSPGEGKGYPIPVFWPLEFHGLYAHGVTMSQTRLSDFHSCFFDDPIDVGNLISGSSAFSNPAGTSGISWFTYC